MTSHGSLSGYFSHPALARQLRAAAEPVARYRQFVQTPEKLAEEEGISVAVASAAMDLCEVDRGESLLFSGEIGRINGVRIIEDNALLK